MPAEFGGRGALDALIGRRLTQLRQRQGISRVDLATAAGVTDDVVCDWEAGRQRIRAAELFDVVRFLEVQLSEIFADLDMSPINRRRLIRLVPPYRD